MQVRSGRVWRVDPRVTPLWAQRLCTTQYPCHAGTEQSRCNALARRGVAARSNRVTQCFRTKHILCCADVLLLRALAQGTLRQTIVDAEM